MTQKNATACWQQSMPSAPCAEGRGFSSRKGSSVNRLWPPASRTGRKCSARWIVILCPSLHPRRCGKESPSICRPKAFTQKSALCRLDGCSLPRRPVGRCTVCHPYPGTRSADGPQRCPTARGMGRQRGCQPPAPEHCPSSADGRRGATQPPALADPGGQAPVSMGLLHNDIPTRVTLRNTTLPPDATIAISLEPEGGSPTGLPTGPVLYSGKL